MNEHEHECRPDDPDALDPSEVPASPAAPEGEGDHRDSPFPDEQKLQPESAVQTVSLDEAPPHGETNVSVVREGIRRYGQPFLAYLVLDGVEQQSPDLIEQYERRYVGSFSGRDAFADWAVEDQGWKADLDELRALNGMWDADLAWDTDRLWPLLVEWYAITERLGGVHAFRR